MIKPFRILERKDLPGGRTLIVFEAAKTRKTGDGKIRLKKLSSSLVTGKGVDPERELFDHLERAGWL
jgi:hypothetical protein